MKLTATPQNIKQCLFPVCQESEKSAVKAMTINLIRAGKNSITGKLVKSVSYSGKQ
jgi:hypothetical protein